MGILCRSGASVLGIVLFTNNATRHDVKFVFFAFKVTTEHCNKVDELNSAKRSDRNGLLVSVSVRSVLGFRSRPVIYSTRVYAATGTVYTVNATAIFRTSTITFHELCRRRQIGELLQGGTF